MSEAKFIREILKERERERLSETGAQPTWTLPLASQSTPLTAENMGRHTGTGLEIIGIAAIIFSLSAGVLLLWLFGKAHVRYEDIYNIPFIIYTVAASIAGAVSGYVTFKLGTALNWLELIALGAWAVGTCCFKIHHAYDLPPLRT